MRELAVSFWGVHPSIILIDWITDRRPTAEDADKDGEVRLRVSRDGDFGAHVPWEYVAEGAPWKHSAIWRPAPEKPALAVGQTWRTREGKVVTITKDDGSNIPFFAGGIWYWPDGKANIHRSNPELELVELISGATNPEPTPRRIVAISSYYNGADHIADAVADDGTAWWCRGARGPWRQYAPLPPIEERH